MQGNRLQDEVMAKEQLRIQRKREANEARRLRILNAKSRMFGLDVDGLNAQLAEKKKIQEQDRDMADYEKLQALEIERILAHSMEEERLMKEFQMRQVRESWEADLARKKAETLRPKSPDFDVENSGPASLQRMTGEDPQRIERVEQQRRQMREWIQEQIAEKSYIKALDKEDDLNYAELIRAIDEIREATEREEQEMRKYITDTIKLENLELARHQNQRRSAQNTISDDAGGAISTSLQVFDEDMDLAMDEQGRIIRKDMFRGYTKAQKQRFFEENQQIMRDKILARKHSDDGEAQWNMQMAMANRAMEQAEYEDKRLRNQLKQEQLAYLRDQIEEQRRLGKDRMEMGRGAIGNEFFERFGKDCR